MVFSNIKEISFDNDVSKKYIIYAKKKIINFKELKKFNLFNKKKIIPQNLYYEDGYINKFNKKIFFKKGYFLEGIFYMKNVQFDINNIHYDAKEANLKKAYSLCKTYYFKNQR